MEVEIKRKGKEMHITRWGNYYTDSEWAEMQAEFAKEAAEAADFIDRLNLLKDQAMQMIRDTGLFAAEQMPKIRSILEDPARAKYTSEEKREIVMAANEWLNNKMRRQ
jgi:hypothetical protein